MVQQIEGSAWWRLTPDNNGNYINGTWTQLASLPGKAIQAGGAGTDILIDVFGYFQ
jgi:hypothetical protein